MLIKGRVYATTKPITKQIPLLLKEGWLKAGEVSCFLYVNA